ncbi:uncharacterized protein LOC111073058 [Drosophila obscura]|uniref:uncharacterized protein LOC111073058 n=1 Tax=Drosophila obscura TaxID=7282 RepID=UPI000BA0E1A2|nr:uncharacterized protein LOC111073058 [Drosophila obscura]XP_022220881.1 uncharacterized protein LOC111073058 [Drosophila obscura]
MAFNMLMSADGIKFRIALPIIQRCGLLMELMDSLELNDERPQNVYLPRIQSKELSKILIWADFDALFSDRFDEEDNEEEFKPWFANYLNVSHQSLLRLWQGAMYLKANGLNRLICKYIRHIILEKPLATLEPLKIQCYLTPAQREQLTKDGVSVESIKKFCMEHVAYQNINTSAGAARASDDNESLE